MADTLATLARTRERFRAFADGEIVPHAEEFDREQRIPSELIKRLAAEGYLGAILPAEAGGPGMDRVTFGALHEEVGRACSSVRSLLTVHSMVAFAVHRWGTAEQKAARLPGLASGDRLGAFCLTEPEAGSDAGRIATTAARTDDGFLINGTKKWITCGQIADVYLVFAKAPTGMSAFLVDRATPGLCVRPLTDIMGTRGSMLAELEFRDCEVGPDALLGPEGMGLSLVGTGALDIGRYSVASGCVGILQACVDACADYTARRVAGAVPLREHQLIRRMLSDMVTNLEAGRLLCQRAGTLKDEASPKTVMATWMAKYFASTAAMSAASDAVQIHGASGCGGGAAVGRYYRDAKIMEIIEGSSQIQQLTIAEEAFQQAAARATPSLSGSEDR
ncbi:acyl-CoA dehydrogenase [Nocardiopsis gilva YIM 90087]|uniref:Acyl-CoA dehydrogenase n=1 Tax=Nocardiopsis gilva YIM 90087 TaxID=1235441 RepID=A0A223S7S2_9ACTN|nr:acyl-CoA dehydrogenase family protein [Nocardiopsis gilva]ASU84185.1 acyl-CoA dehydrogenase [Nocardiopsis gilva YIM 90087]